MTRKPSDLTHPPGGRQWGGQGWDHILGRTFWVRGRSLARPRRETVQGRLLVSILPFLFVLAPLAIYLIVALRKTRTEITADEFFESRGLISPSEFANSSVAYGFQIASVSVLFAFGFCYGLGGIVNPLFWGVGIILFMLVCGRLGNMFVPSRPEKSLIILKSVQRHRYPAYGTDEGNVHKWQALSSHLG